MSFRYAYSTRTFAKPVVGDIALFVVWAEPQHTWPAGTPQSWSVRTYDGANWQAVVIATDLKMATRAHQILSDMVGRPLTNLDGSALTTDRLTVYVREEC